MRECTLKCAEIGFESGSESVFWFEGGWGFESECGFKFRSQCGLRYEFGFECGPKPPLVSREPPCSNKSVPVTWLSLVSRWSLVSSRDATCLRRPRRQRECPRLPRLPTPVAPRVLSTISEY